MAKQRYEVVRPWAGVSLGDVIDLDPEKIHPAIKSNIRQVVKAAKPKTDEADKVLADARAQAEGIKAEADKVLADARAQAEKILTDAYAEAEALKAKK